MKDISIDINKSEALSQYWFKPERKEEYARFLDSCAVAVKKFENGEEMRPFIYLGFRISPPKNRQELDKALECMSRYVVNDDPSEMDRLIAAYNDAQDLCEKLKIA